MHVSVEGVEPLSYQRGGGSLDQNEALTILAILSDRPSV